MEYESLESHIDCQLADLPESIRHAMSPIRKMLWDGLRPEGRIPLAIEHDCQNNPALASGREAIAESAYEETGLNGTSIDWRYWVHQIPFLSAAEAARLMSALDPEKFCNLANRPGTDDPSEHCKKAEKIQRLAEREGMVEATPSAWIAWANERRILVHAGFRIEVECLNIEPPHSPAQHTAKPAPVKDVGASGGVEPASDTPAPLTTNAIANCFAGLRDWDGKRWKSELGSPDKWLESCRQAQGTRGRGGYQATWWPVDIAAALVQQRHVSAKMLSARFKHQEPLKPWLATWEQHDPDSFE